MALFEPYLDEDLDFYEGLSEDYLDLDEDFEEIEEEDYGEARRGGRRRVPMRGRGKARWPPLNRLRGPVRNTPVAGRKPIHAGNVRKAFHHVGQDVSVLGRKVMKAEKKQSNEQLLEMLALIFFKPKPITTTLATPLKGADGQEIKEVTTGIENNLLPLILIKLFANSGSGTKTGSQQYLVIGLAVLLLFPDALKGLGLGGLNLNGTPGAKGTGTAPDMDLLMKAGLIYLVGKGKL